MTRENHFGPEVAARYDEASASMFAPEVLGPAVDRLEELAARGVPVSGIELSEAMVEQRMVSHHFTAAEGGFRHYPIPFRYVWPSELDLMARLAGLRLRHRWGDRLGAPFTEDGRSHVSVLEVAIG